MFVHSHIGCGCNSDTMGAAIGITYDNDVANWDVPNTEWYVPKPADISCDAVDSYIALLTDYIKQWQERLDDASHALIRNRNKINNAQFMVNALNQRYGEYQVRKDICLNPPPPPVLETPVEDPAPSGGDGSGSGSSSGGSSLLWIGLAAAGVIVFSKLKKRRQRRRSKE